MFMGTSCMGLPISSYLDQQDQAASPTSLLHPLCSGPTHPVPPYYASNLEPTPWAIHLFYRLGITPVKMGTFCMSPLSPTTRLQMEDEVIFLIKVIFGGRALPLILIRRRLWLAHDNVFPQEPKIPPDP